MAKATNTWEIPKPMPNRNGGRGHGGYVHPRKPWPPGSSPKKLSKRKPSPFNPGGRRSNRNNRNTHPHMFERNVRAHWGTHPGGNTNRSRSRYDHTHDGRSHPHNFPTTNPTSTGRHWPRHPGGRVLKDADRKPYGYSHSHRRAGGRR